MLQQRQETSWKYYLACSLSMRSFKKQSDRVFYKKGALKNFKKLKGETTTMSSFSSKGAGLA